MDKKDYVLTQEQMESVMEGSMSRKEYPDSWELYWDTWWAAYWFQGAPYKGFRLEGMEHSQGPNGNLWIFQFSVWSDDEECKADRERFQNYIEKSLADPYNDCISDEFAWMDNGGEQYLILITSY